MSVGKDSNVREKIFMICTGRDGKNTMLGGDVMRVMFIIVGVNV